MEYSQEHSSADSSTGGGSVSALEVEPSQNPPTDLEKICDETTHLYGPQTQILASTGEEETVLPLPPNVVPFVNYHQTEQTSEPGEKIKQPADNSGNRYQQVTPTRISRHKLTQLNLPRIQFAVEEKQEPNELSEYISKLPKSSTEFIYHGETIPVNVERLSKSKFLDRGNFGSVSSVVIKELSLIIPMAVKRIPIQTEEKHQLATYTELTTMETVGSGKTPCIVDYYCSFVDPETRELCICMELMDTTLEKFYKAMHELGEVEPDKLDNFVRRCAYNAVKGLEFLASKHIVHRDVKPANMLINKDGVGKLCDLGICGDLTHTKLDFSTVMGSIAYLPPIPDKCAIQGDMWALGISLLEIIKGEHPFADGALYGLEFRCLAWEPTVPTTISPDIQKFMLHLLQKEADDRPRSYKDIINKYFICNMIKKPSDDEIDFVRQVIEHISPSERPSG